MDSADYSEMAVLRSLGAAVGFAVALAARADTETWGGHLNMAQYANNVPVNVTVDGNTATVSFVYDVNARGIVSLFQCYNGYPIS